MLRNIMPVNCKCLNALKYMLSNNLSQGFKDTVNKPHYSSFSVAIMLRSDTNLKKLPLIEINQKRNCKKKFNL